MTQMMILMMNWIDRNVLLNHRPTQHQSASPFPFDDAPRRRWVGGATFALLVLGKIRLSSSSRRAGCTNR